MDKKTKDRFDTVDKRFDVVDQRLDGIDNRLDGIDNRLDGIDNRLDNLDVSVGEIKKDVKFLTVSKIDKTDIEEVVERVAGKKIDKMLKILDDQSKYFQEQEMLKGQVDRHDKWINKIALKTDVKLDY